MKFTFKKEPRETGLSGVGNPTPSTQIKLNKKVCGLIRAPNWQTKDNKWSLGLTVKSEGIAGWVWIFFKPRFDTEQAARDWLISKADVIASRYEVCSYED